MTQHFLDDTGLSTLWNKIKAWAAPKSHNHSYSSLTDKPTIPDDSGLLHRTGVETISGKKYFNGGIEMGLSIISNMDDPKYAYDAANKHYVDDAVSGKYSKPSSGIPETDLAQAVQDKLNASGSGDYLPLSGGTMIGDLRLEKQSGDNSKINFGDGEYVYLYEDDDDHLTIFADAGINLFAGQGYGFNEVSVHGDRIATSQNDLGGYKIQVVTALPTTPNANTIYFIK